MSHGKSMHPVVVRWISVPLPYHQHKSVIKSSLDIYDLKI